MAIEFLTDEWAKAVTAAANSDEVPQRGKGT